MKIKRLLAVATPLLLTQFIGCRAELDWREEHDVALAALEAGQLETARERLVTSSQQAEHLGESDLFFERSMIALAQAQRDSGMLEDAERNFRRAYVVREARLGTQSAELAEVLTPLAEVCEAQGKCDVAANMREHLLVIEPEN